MVALSLAGEHGMCILAKLLPELLTDNPSLRQETPRMLEASCPKDRH